MALFLSLVTSWKNGGGTEEAGLLLPLFFMSRFRHIPKYENSARPAVLSRKTALLRRGKNRPLQYYYSIPATPAGGCCPPLRENGQAWPLLLYSPHLYFVCVAFWSFCRRLLPLCDQLGGEMS